MNLSRCKKGFVTLGTLGVLLLTFPFAASLFMRQGAQPFLYASASSTPNRQTALVLGAAAYPSRLSDILQDRMDTAIELFKAGKTKTLLLSGAPNEVDKMAEYALAQGLQTEDLEQDPKGLNTLASVQNAAKNHKALIIVTQNFHLPRAIFMARRLGIDAVGTSADRHEYIKIFDFKKRELLASTKAILDLYWPIH
ncbi:YdcF family protein [Candidatus Peregrinibacteria bacterium]|nr:YdcF family protein [Candidatus Peregrinibacteria bacterium]